MLTAAEYIKEKPTTLYIHGLEALKHCLKGDYQQTAYRDPNPDMTRLAMFQDEITRHVENAQDFNEHYKDKLKLGKTRKRHKSTSGDFNTERYINGSKRPFDASRKTIGGQRGVTVLFCAGINAQDVNGKIMEERHKRAYDFAAKCFNERRPCRIIAVKWNQYIHESTQPFKTFKLYVIVKDFNDPLFPTIWGAYKTNASTNMWSNIMWDFLIGTHSDGHGQPSAAYVLEDFQEDRIHVISDPKARINTATRRILK